MAFTGRAIKVTIVEGARKGPDTSGREKGVPNLSRRSREWFSSAATSGVRLR